MAQLQVITCNACKKSISPDAGRISFLPLRGGLTFVVHDGKHNAGMDITQQMDFCDEKCLAAAVAEVRKQIVKPQPAKAATPTETAK